MSRCAHKNTTKYTGNALDTRPFCHDCKQIVELYVYVAGPFTGDQVVNTRLAIDAAESLRRAGFIPFVPHLNMFWYLIYPNDYEEWLRMDLAWLENCNVILRLEGESMGADREVAHAKAKGIEVFSSIDELKIWASMVRAK